MVSMTDDVVDVSDIPAPVALPKGAYLGTVSSIEMKLNKSANVMVAVQYTIGVDQYPVDYDVENAPDGVKLTNFVTLNFGMPGVDKQPSRIASQRYREMLKMHGMSHTPTVTADAQLGGKWAPSEAVMQEMIGRQVKLEVIHEVYEGEERAKIYKVASVA